MCKSEYMILVWYTNTSLFDNLLTHSIIGKFEGSIIWFTVSEVEYYCEDNTIFTDREHY